MLRSSPLPSLLKDLLALYALAGAVLAFHPLLAASNTLLTDYDLYAYFYPYWQYKAEVMRAGHLPLWNPYLFTGVPFLANIQSGVFYPPNLLMLGLEAPSAAALSYLLHLWLAAAGMYLLLRFCIGLGILGSLAGSVVFGLGGFFAAQAGHINQVQAAAWLPLLALAFLKAYQGRSIPWLAGGALIFGLQVTAGHPQESFLTLSTLALLAFYEALRSALHKGPAPEAWLNQRLKRPQWFLLRFAGWSAYAGALLATMAGLGAGLAAVQLLPSLELAGQSVRAGGLSYPEATSFSLPPPELLRSLLPTYTDPPLNEYTSYVGAFALSLGWASLLRLRQRPYTLFFAGVFLVGLLLAFGGFTPIYHLLYKYAPGFDLFRVPARWLFLCTFGAAGLAGTGLDILAKAEPRSQAKRALASASLVLAGSSILAVGGVWALRAVLVFPPPEILPWWLVTGLAGLTLTILGATLLRGQFLASLLLGFVVLELFYGRAPFAVSHPVPIQAYTTVRPGLAQVLQDPGVHRTLSIANPAYEPGDLAELRALLSTKMPPSEADSFIIVTKYNETLAPNLGLRFHTATLDGYDGGLLPTREIAALNGLVMEQGGAASPAQSRRQAADPAALIRDHILGIPDPVLLGLLNVKYIIADRLSDAWTDGYYHDLGVARHLAQGERLRLEPPPGTAATALSLGTYLEGEADIPQGTLIATVTVQGAGGVTRSWPLRAGMETGDSAAEALAAGAPSSPATAVPRRGLPHSSIFLARLDFRGVLFPQTILIEGQQPAGVLTVAGATLVDERTRSSIALDVDARLRRVHTGDVKVYENTAFQERAYLASQVLVIEDSAAQLEALPRLRPSQVILARAPDLPWTTLAAGPAKGPSVSGNSSEARIEKYEPEEVIVGVSAREPGVLVLSDTFYPGWRAWMDDKEVEVLRANYLFRAVLVPAGQHQVRFRYEPPPLRTGWVISWWSGVLVTALLLVWPSARWLVKRVRVFPLSPIRGRGLG